MSEEVLSSNLLTILMESTVSIAATFESTSTEVTKEIEAVIQMIETWERLAPELYQMRKSSSFAMNSLPEKGRLNRSRSWLLKCGRQQKRASRVRGKREFVRRKSAILTDTVIGKIRDYIGEDQVYRKSRDIYHYLVQKKFIKAFPGPRPERSFAIALARVDQDVIAYNGHPGIMAWGLPDSNSPEPSQRKAVREKNGKHEALQGHK